MDFGGGSWEAARAHRVDDIPGVEILDGQGPGAEFCDARVPVPPSGLPSRNFSLPAEHEELCRSLKDRPNGAAAYAGRNWCWAWMKHAGCLWTRGHWSWWEAQQRMHQQRRAPDPRKAPMTPILRAELCERPVLGEAALHTKQQATKALEWMVANVAIYVVNLESAADRWVRMEGLLRALGLEATRVAGVDMAAPGALGRAVQDGLVPRSYNTTRVAEVAREQSVGGIVGSIGVAAAHLRALGIAASGRGASLALILEDDSELLEGFAVKLRRLLVEAPCDWKAISLKSRCGFGECVSPHLTRVRPDGNEPEDRCRHGVNYGFYAMLYRVDGLGDVRRGLWRRVWDPASPHCLDVDVALASLSEEIPYYAVPAVQQPGFIREGHQGSDRYTKNKLEFPPTGGVVGARGSLDSPTA